MSALTTLQDEMARCRACPRLVEWRQRVASEKRAAFASEDYWGKPVPGFGDPAARVLIVGLAPAAHGANRTGRMFTGDRSGDWLFRALHRAGFASQPESTGRGDGLVLTDVYVTAAVRCAPPDNRPTVGERDRCGIWLRQERALLPGVRVIVCLGGFAWDVVHRQLVADGIAVPRPRVPFGHGVLSPTGGPMVIGSYHPSQQNTFTGRLTEAMFDDIFETARGRLDLG